MAGARLPRSRAPSSLSPGVGIVSPSEQPGDGLQTVAAALGVAPWSLRRWAEDGRLWPVAAVADLTTRAPAGVVVIVSADTLRVEGLDVEMATQLVARLR